MMEVFDKFKELHPNSAEVYNPTAENIARWEWHIKEREKMPKFKEFVFEQAKEWSEYVDRTRSDTWDDLPRYMKERYLEIAAHFPNVQVYACGSRVSGGYVESFTPKEIREMRRKAGKPDKVESDYDFTVLVEVDREIEYDLPSWCDWLKYDPGPKIAIPMWNFERLPEKEHGRVIDALQRRDERTLLEIHNAYQLSDYTYCCNLTGVVNHFIWAVENGIINGNNERAVEIMD